MLRIWAMLFTLTAFKEDMMGKVYNVIDVSEWQGNIDWKKVKAAGIDGVIIRYADGTYLDKKFDYNMKNAIAVGLHVGCYIFSRAKDKSGAEKEATRLFNAASKYKYDMPLYIDLEANGLGKYADTVAAAFLNKIKALGGVGGVYANLNWWNNYLTKTAKNYSASPFWIAQYYSEVTHKKPSLFGMWQYTSSGKVDGIKGRVDRDRLYIAYWDRDKPQPQPKPPEPEKQPYPGTFPTLKLVKTPDEVIADAIRFAKWITGDNRFGYGRMGGAKYKGTTEYSITHSGGCHFCGSNAHKIAKAKKAGLKNPEEWEFTYVCNTFVHACYAHAGVIPMLNARGHAWWTGNYQKSELWKEIKKPKKITDCQPGDVFGWDSHYCLYLGNGKGAEATSGGGNPAASKEAWAKSIRICDFSRHFKAATHIFRYVGPVNSTTLIRYGEVSKRVTLLQKFLNWYGDYKLAEDGLFGDATLKAVKDFQKKSSITVDGIVGSGTIAAMKKAVK